MSTNEPTQAQLTQKIRELVAASGNDLEKSAQACRASGFTAEQSVPVLYTMFDTESADRFAAVAVTVWGASLSSDGLKGILGDCKKKDGSRAFTDAAAATAVSAAMSLTFLDVAHVPTSYGGAVNDELKTIGLSQGDLTAIKAAEGARYLIVSCFPGDYQPLPGTMVEALRDAYGVSLEALAADPAADYRTTHHCWISKELSAYTTQQTPYQRILCLESGGANIEDTVPGVFAAIQAFEPNPPAIPNTGATILSALVSTGDARADKSRVLRLMFDACWNFMSSGDGPGYNLTNFRIVIHNPDWNDAMIRLFDQLKQARR